MRAVRDGLPAPMVRLKNRKALVQLTAGLGVPVDGRVRKLRAVGDQSGHPPRRKTSKLGRIIMFVQRAA